MSLFKIGDLSASFTVNFNEFPEKDIEDFKKSKEDELFKATHSEIDHIRIPSRRLARLLFSVHHWQAITWPSADSLLIKL